VRPVYTKSTVLRSIPRLMNNNSPKIELKRKLRYNRDENLKMYYIPTFDCVPVQTRAQNFRKEKERELKILIIYRGRK